MKCVNSPDSRNQTTGLLHPDALFVPLVRKLQLEVVAILSIHPSSNPELKVVSWEMWVQIPLPPTLSEARPQIVFVFLGKCSLTARFIQQTIPYFELYICCYHQSLWIVCPCIRN